MPHRTDVSLISPPYQPVQYSESEFRYKLRTKPFAAIRNPPRPPFSEFQLMTTLSTSSKVSPEVQEKMNDVLTAEPQKHSIGILVFAEAAIQNAKAPW